MARYIVWISYGSDGWQPSREFETLKEAINETMTSSYSSEIRVTKLVDYEITEVQEKE